MRFLNVLTMVYDTRDCEDLGVCPLLGTPEKGNSVNHIFSLGMKEFIHVGI
jgi:hypothetical protein